MPDLNPSQVVLLIALMSIVTYIPRVFPVLILSRRRLPEPVERWLSYVPVAVLAALLAPALFAPEGTLDFAAATNPAFWVSIPVFGIAILTRNLFATVLSGMLMIALFKHLMS